MTSVSTPPLDPAAATPSAEGKAPVPVAVDGRPAGVLAVADTVKDDSAAVIAVLQRLGVDVVMLTGDNARTAAQAGVDRVLPEHTDEEIRRLRGEDRTAGMVGDGIDDAPPGHRRQRPGHRGRRHHSRLRLSERCRRQRLPAAPPAHPAAARGRAARVQPWAESTADRAPAAQHSHRSRGPTPPGLPGRRHHGRGPGVKHAGGQGDRHRTPADRARHPPPLPGTSGAALGRPALVPPPDSPWGLDPIRRMLEVA
ncbi:HAD family hydrolase [Streptomyces sp. NPDC058442]|uniref:HAD family hydrolase n=1 Tax=Streptomyces sp. NPDC058442 TaxID=3346503 RepID=UPI00364F281C